MKQRERVLKSLNHIETDCIPVDFGGTVITGMHCNIIKKLRDYYGLEYKPVTVIEPFQMLGHIDDDLQDILDKKYQ